MNEYADDQPKSSMFDPLPEGGSARRVSKKDLDNSSSKDLRPTNDAVNSSSVQREIAAQESDR